MAEAPFLPVASLDDTSPSADPVFNDALVTQDELRAVEATLPTGDVLRASHMQLPNGEGGTADLFAVRFLLQPGSTADPSRRSPTVREVLLGLRAIVPLGMVVSTPPAPVLSRDFEIPANVDGQTFIAVGIAQQGGGLVDGNGRPM